MDSELTGFMAIAILIMVVISTIILSLPIRYAVHVAIASCVVFSLVFGFLGLYVTSYGKSPGGWEFPLFFCSGFLLTAGTSYLIRFVIYPFLQGHGLLVTKIALIMVVVGFLVYRYSAHYGEYSWQTERIYDEENEIVLLSSSVYGLKKSTYYDRELFESSRAIFAARRLYPVHSGRDEYTPKWNGRPQHLMVIYYVPESEIFYKGEFNLHVSKIEKLTASRLFYPITKYQRYNKIELLLLKDGVVSLQLANDEQSLEVLSAKAQVIKKDELSESQLKLYKHWLEDHEKLIADNAEEITTAQNEDFLLLLREQKYTIQHEITGLRDQIVSVSVISANGEYYRVDKKFWDGRSMSKLYHPPVTINIVTINNHGKYHNWNYEYDPSNIASVLKESGLLSSVDERKEIKFSYHLRSDENDLLRATTFEYFNGKKYELTGDMGLYPADQYYK
jgi:phosphate starvation-inducible membrane PsiE